MRALGLGYYWIIDSVSPASMMGSSVIGTSVSVGGHLRRERLGAASVCGWAARGVLTGRLTRASKGNEGHSGVPHRTRDPTQVETASHSPPSRPVGRSGCVLVGSVVILRGRLGNVASSRPGRSESRLAR